MTCQRVLFLAAGVNSPSFRFRIRQYLPYLKAENIQAEIGELAVAPAQRRQWLHQAANYDAVLVHRALLSWPEHRLLRRHAPSYVFEFDDAILFRDSAHRNLRSWRRRLRFQRMVRAAHRVIAGNAYLQTWAERDNTRTIVIPTTIELADYPLAPPGGVQTPVIGWIGTRVNLMYLDTLYGALAQVARGTCHPRLKVVCDAFPDMPGIEIEKKVWKLADEPADARSFQVGIMPLPEDDWTRGKCGLKLLQYMAASVPVVCSPVGANCEIVQDGINGLYARTEAEWIDRLERLLGDAPLRARLGQAGRDTIEKKYSTAHNAPLFRDALFD
jgi:glycosyltransferase involved in cell wall biosynthesis